MRYLLLWVLPRPGHGYTVRSGQSGGDVECLLYSYPSFTFYGHMSDCSHHNYALLYHGQTGPGKYSQYFILRLSWRWDEVFLCKVSRDCLYWQYKALLWRAWRVSWRALLGAGCQLVFSAQSGSWCGSENIPWHVTRTSDYELSSLQTLNTSNSSQTPGYSPQNVHQTLLPPCICLTGNNNSREDLK